jgi:hypothetical protein
MQHDEFKPEKFLIIGDYELELLHTNFNVRWSKGYGQMSFVNSGLKRVYGSKEFNAIRSLGTYKFNEHNQSLRVVLEITNKKKAMLTRMRLGF